MPDDALVVMCDQLALVAVVAAGVSATWLSLLLVVALRHRHSPAVAARALRRLGAPHALVRVVLLLIGLGLTAPAHATGADRDPADAGTGSATQTRLARSLDGLPSPALPAPGPPVPVLADTRPRGERVSPPPSARPSTAHRVVAGDSLWAVTADHLPGASDVEVDRGWRRLYSANRDAVGADPDLLRVGVRLDLTAIRPDPAGGPGPEPTTTEPHTTEPHTTEQEIP